MASVYLLKLITQRQLSSSINFPSHTIMMLTQALDNNHTVSSRSHSSLHSLLFNGASPVLSSHWKSMMARPKRQRWTSEEDNKLIEFKDKYPGRSWSFIAKQAGLRRNRQSCSERWTNHLSPDVNRGNFSQEDDDAIIRLQRQGNRWAFIGTRLQPRRTRNDVKNYWNNHLKKKLEIRDLERRLLTDDGTSDHSVQGDDLDSLMAKFASLIPNIDPNAS